MTALSLKSRATLFTVAMFLACMWLFAFFGQATVRETMQAAVSREQQLAASFIAAGINQEFEERFNALESIAASISAETRADPVALRAALDSRPVFQRMFGNRTFASGTALNDRVGAAAAAAPQACIDAVLRSGKAMACEPSGQETGRGPLVALVAPIAGADGRATGTVGGFTELAGSTHLKLSRRSVGNATSYRLVSPAHRLTLVSSDSAHTMQPLPTRGSNPAIDRLLDSGNAAGVRVVFDGVDTLATVVPVPVAGWQIIVTVPAHVAFAPLDGARERILLAAFVLSLLTAGLTWQMLDRQLAPLLDATRILSAHTDATQPLEALPIAHDDEIGALIGSFNRLLDQEQRHQKALQAGEHRLAVVLDAVQSAVITFSEHGMIESCNEYAVQVFGYAQEELAGRDISLIMPGLGRPGDGWPGASGRTREIMGRRKDGTAFPGELRLAEAVVDGTTLFVGSVNDISFRKRAEEELRIAAIAFESQQAMFVTDADTVILRINQAFTEVTGYTSDEVVGCTPRILQSGQHGAAFYCEMWESINTTGRWKGEILGRRKNGAIYPKWLTITAVTDPQGVVTHYVGAHFDISERKQKEDQVRKLAFYDPLTELPNRRLLGDRLNHAMALSRRNGTFGALMFLDLDNFKSLNDTHGHAVGDLLLIEAAQRLKRCVRQVDTVARFGGDEFVVMLSDLHTDRDEAVRLATLVGGKIRLAIAQAYLLTVQGEQASYTVEHHCTVSIGVALFRSARPDDILKWADAAMYVAKQSGKNEIRFSAS